MTPDYSDCPTPLVPSVCDMGSNDYFPLYFDRLRGSRWWRRASDLCRARNVMLWGEAYKANPAGSLPDDDDELAEAAGFGFDVDAFLAAKAEIMAPWVLCNDGRWYHPTLCEVVLETWEKTSETRRQARIRKAEQRERLRAKTRVVTPKARSVTQDNANVTRDTPKSHAGQTCNKEKVEERLEVGTNVPVASASPDATGGILALAMEDIASAKTDPWERDEDFTRLWDMAPPKMRVRAKSKAKVWSAWTAARKLALPKTILAGFARYKSMDTDLPRSGGPGLHIWLKDRAWEPWVGGVETDRAASWTESEWSIAMRIWRETGTWGEGIGAPPGQPGCRVPARLLVQPAHTTGATA